MIHSNAAKANSDAAASAVRAGRGLLTGLLRCGRCGRKLDVRYWGRGGTAPRYLCKGDFDAGGKYCLGFAGRLVDQRFEAELLKVVSPVGVAASLQAVAELSAGSDDRRLLLERQVEQLDYEAKRAFEQYNAVDPRNRLVAAELERRWNVKLDELEAVKLRLSELQKEVPQLSDVQRNEILELGANFEQVWNGPGCSSELKKKIARTVIEEVIANTADENTLHFIIHWKGGVHTEFTMARPSVTTTYKTTLAALEIIRKMAVRYGDDQIAAVLNQLGHFTGKGKRWSENSVKTARHTYTIPGQRRTVPNPEILSLTAAAHYCGVSHRTLERLVEHGFLKVEQLVPRAPWEIRRGDLDIEPVAGIIQHLKQTGKLILERGSADLQIFLPLEITGDNNARYNE